MKIMPESIIEAFQKSEEFSFGARTIDFYQKLGFNQDDMRKLLETNKEVLFGKENYIVGLTKDSKNMEYVTIVPYPEDVRRISLMASKIIITAKKESRNNRRY